jgi:hypothetical protein
MTFGCHDTATSLPLRPRRSSKKWQVKCKWWSLYNVLIYLQKQLDILAKTYFWTRPGQKWLTSWSTVNISWSRPCNLNREAWRSYVTMTTTVYQNNFSVECRCKTFRTFTRVSVDGAWISICLVAKAVEHLPNTTENANFSLDCSGLAISAASSNLFGVCVCVACVSSLVCKKHWLQIGHKVNPFFVSSRSHVWALNNFWSYQIFWFSTRKTKFSTWHPAVFF